MAKGFLLERMTWPQAQEAFKRTSVVVVPIGSTEQHGPHLPLGTDFLVAQELARRLGGAPMSSSPPRFPSGMPNIMLFSPARFRSAKRPSPAP